MVDLKNDVVDEILRSTGLEPVGRTEGSSGYKEALLGVIRRFNIEVDESLDKPHLGRAIVEAAGFEWIPGGHPPRSGGYDSTLSRSGGGDTVTVPGWRAILRAVRELEGRAIPEEASSLEREVRARLGLDEQGRISDAVRRRAIEQRAVDLATELLVERGWEVEDVGSTQSFDLLCHREGVRLDVEVKGTTGSGQAVHLTANEVKHASEMRTCLIVVHSIVVHGDEAQGGVLVEYEDWQPRPEDLSATVYRYQIP